MFQTSYDPDDDLIIEIKPNRPGMVIIGLEQAARYADLLGVHNVQVWTYPAGTSPSDFKNPMQMVNQGGLWGTGNKTDPTDGMIFDPFLP